MTQPPRRRVCTTIDVVSGIDAIAAIVATLNASETGFTRLGSGCVVVSAQGGELHFIPITAELQIEIRHPENAACLQPMAQDLMMTALQDHQPLAWR